MLTFVTSGMCSAFAGAMLAGYAGKAYQAMGDPYLLPTMALGCLGTVTNGSIRDIAAVAGGFQMLAGSIAPSHAYVHIIEFDLPVTVHSMAVKSGDLIHADRHGAVVVPAEKIDAMHAALDGLMKQEARIIAAARAPGATVETIKAAFRG